jgi:hypothetical protein
MKEIGELIENNTLNLQKSQMLLINAYSLIYMCDHYYQTEYPLINKNDLMVNKDLSNIKDYDIIHCEVIFLNEFYYEVLEKIDKKIILTTGKWHLPQVAKSELTEKILQHKNVLLWVSQNPIYNNSDKYLAFPYGLYPDTIEKYARALYYIKKVGKTKKIIHLHLQQTTNPSRLKLPIIHRIDYIPFLKEIAQAEFLLSPIGDRDDCYRHYEAIGLGTIPVSNVNDLYKNIFTTNMVYNNIDEMANMLNDDNLNLVYKEPNKDLICYEYWKDIVHKKIADIKYANSIQEGKYYVSLMKEISELIENDTLDLPKSQKLLINPNSLIYMCDHYYKPEHPLPERGVINNNDLLINKDLAQIKDYDIVHCGIDYLSIFLNEILNKIDKKIILTTGQVQNPTPNELTDKILEHKNVLLWVSQNPIYDNSDKYLAFPFGLNIDSVYAYATFLYYCKIEGKPNNLIHLPLNYTTNPCRLKLPIIPRISSTQFWIEIVQAKFILSPIGDRDDCYRNYEAIGLGTIPISNVNELYKNIFTTNMIYSNIDEMANMLHDDNLNLVYKEPNKDLICYEYWKDIVYKKIADIKYANGISSVI